MKEVETIEVYVRTEMGKTICICQRDNKGCRQKCQPDTVERDRFRGWQETMNRDKYGK